MKTLILVLFFLSAGNAQSQDYSVTSYSDHAEVVNLKFGYRFRAPTHWYVSQTNPVPYTFSYAPRQMKFAQVGVPKGGADLSITPDKTGYNAGSIDRWIEIQKQRSGYSSPRDLGAELNHLIPKAIEVISYEDDGDRDREQVVHISTIFFEFDGQLFAATLRFNANDPKARHYQQCLYDVLRSFQRVSAK